MTDTGSHSPSGRPKGELGSCPPSGAGPARPDGWSPIRSAVRGGRRGGGRPPRRARAPRDGGWGSSRSTGRAPAGRSGDQPSGRAGPAPTGEPGGDTNQRIGPRPHRRPGPGGIGAARAQATGTAAPPPLPSSPPPIPLVHSLMRRSPPLRPSALCHSASFAGTGVAPPTAGRGGRPKIGDSGPGHPMGPRSWRVIDATRPCAGRALKPRER